MGGQGHVYMVEDRSATEDEDFILRVGEIFNNIRNHGVGASKIQDDARSFVNALQKTLSKETIPKAALKILHPRNGLELTDEDKARMANEIEINAKISHPNLLKIIQAYPLQHAFVMELMPRTLTECTQNFVGRPIESLKTFRGLVSTVAYLHGLGITHRDIKPDNIFINEYGELVLADFGIAFYQDADRTRITDTLEKKVGSWPWMPQWSLGKRVKDVKHNHDVYGLGKVLWSMFTGIPELHNWYFENDAFPTQNIRKLFPNLPGIEAVAFVLKKSVTEFEADCLENASDLLKLVDESLGVLMVGGSLVKGDRLCRACGRGQYQIVFEPNTHPGSQRWFPVTAGHSFRVMVCPQCGHVQGFSVFENKERPAWDPQNPNR